MDMCIEKEILEIEILKPIMVFYCLGVTGGLFINLFERHPQILALILGEINYINVNIVSVSMDD